MSVTIKKEINERVLTSLKSLDGKIGKAGWFDGSTYPTLGQPAVAYVATIQEYGYKPGNIPPRPFLRPTIRIKKRKWADIARFGAMKVVEGKGSAADIMRLVAGEAKNDIENAIIELHSPALKDSTIAARLRKRADKKTIGNLEKPLIDTGRMLATLDSTVEDA